MHSPALQTARFKANFKKQFYTLPTVPHNLRLQRQCELWKRSLAPISLKTTTHGRRTLVRACCKPGVTGDNSNKEKQGWDSEIKHILLVILTTGAIMFARNKWGNRSVAYSSFLEKLSAKEIEEVQVDGAVLRFKLKQEIGCDDKKKKAIVYTTKRPDDAMTPYRVMQENNVAFWSPHNISVWSLLRYMLMAYLCVKVLNRLYINFFLKKRSDCGDSGSEVIMFSDVAGVDEAKEELQEIVDFLRSPDRYTRLGARQPRGVLLVGPPGTGKTMLAKAVAGEAGVPFIACSASEFVEIFAGKGAFHVRRLFAQAKKKAPSIIFIDEIDAVGKSRGRHSFLTHDEQEQTLNQLLTEMDGFDTSSAVIVLAATNRSDVLDEALCRPGRFDRMVMVEAPDNAGRQSILNVHVSKKGIPLGNDVDLGHISCITSGFSGAELANVINEAALLAGRQNKAAVEKIDFINAVERSIAGIQKKSSRLVGEEKATVAGHEAGHAIVCTAVTRIISGQPAVEKLSIQPRSGGVLGFTFSSPTTENKHLDFVDELRGTLVSLLGGRAAEQVLFPDRVSTGAADDLHQATKLAYEVVAENGLDFAVGPISMATLTDVGGSSMNQGHLGDLIQKEVKLMLQSALNVAVCVMHANLKVLEGLSARLEEKEKLEGDELQEWLDLVIAPFELADFVRGKQDNHPLQTASELSQEQRLNSSKRAC